LRHRIAILGSQSTRHRSTRHVVDSSPRGGQLITVRSQLVTSKSKQTAKPYCHSSNYP